MKQLVFLGLVGGWIKENIVSQSAHKKEAARDLCEALRKTRRYIHERDNGNYSMDKQRDLFEYWDKASVSLRRVNKNLSQRCKNKGLYWLNPDAYSSEDLHKLGIELNNIDDDITAFTS